MVGEGGDEGAGAGAGPVDLDCDLRSVLCSFVVGPVELVQQLRPLLVHRHFALSRQGAINK